MRICISVLIALQALFVSAAAAEGYPNRPIRLVVPFSAGGVADIIARVIAPPMSGALGQTVYVENRPGAGGTIGTGEMAKSDPDGYSLILEDMAFTITAWVYPNIRYDPRKDFTPVSLVANTPQWLFVSATTPVKSVADLVAMAKKAPGKYTIGSSGNGTGTHMMAELLMREAGIKLTHVPYKGSGPAVAAASTGEINAVFAFMPSAAPFIRSGRIRTIAVTAKERIPGYTNIPTFTEAGFGNIVVEHWLGIMAPTGLPASVLNKVSAAIKIAVKDDAVARRFKSLALEPTTSTSEQLKHLIESDLKRWGSVVHDAHIKIQ